MRSSILLLAALILLYSCTKKPDNKTTGGNTSTFYQKWIPNWYSGDTLFSVVYDTLNNPIGDDTVYTLTIGDTSCLVYHGVKLYIWKLPLLSTDTFKNNQSEYVNCCINTIPFDTTHNWAYTWETAATPYKYLQPDGVTWQHQTQSIIVGNILHFKNVSGGVYYSIIQH